MRGKPTGQSKLGAPQSVAEVWRDNVVLELEGIDRMYRNVYVPVFQAVEGFCSSYAFTAGIRCLRRRWSSRSPVVSWNPSSGTPRALIFSAESPSERACRRLGRHNRERHCPTPETPSILQMELSPQGLDRPVSGRIFCEEVIRENLDIARPEQVQLIFER